jgi:hypothetical protein
MNTIFLSYAREDKPHVDNVYRHLKAEGLLPWMDKPPCPFRSEGIPPGAIWDREIRKQLQRARVVLAFLSGTSIAKQGYIQKEYRLALSEMMKKPSEEIYLIPVLIENCDLPDMQVDTINLKDLQWFELFSRGIDELVDYLRLHTSSNDLAQSPRALPIGEVVERNREYLWDVDLSSVNGLILVHMASLARERDVAVDLKELSDRLKCVDYLYAYGFLVALRTAKLVLFRSDFKTFWRFDYDHPALTRDIKGDLRKRIEQMLRDEGLSAGHGSPFEGDIRVVEDYIEELAEKGKKPVPRNQRRQSASQNGRKRVKGR